MNHTSPIKKLAELMRLEKKDISNIYLFAGFNGLVQLSLPLGVQSIIGFVLGGSFSSSIAVLILFVVLGVFFSGLMQIQQMKIIERIQQKIFHYYAFAFKSDTIETNLQEADNLYFPELMNRFLDVTTLQKSFSKVLLDIPLASIQILLGLLIVSLFHPLFLILIIVLITLIILLFILTSKRGLDTSIKESSAKYKVTGWLEEIARVVHVFKFSRAYQLQTTKMDNKVGEYIDYRTRHFNILLFQFKNLIFLKVLITALMLLLGTFLLINQQLNIGQFVAAEIIIITMINSVEKIIVNLDSFYDILTALDKLNVTHNQPKERSIGHEYLPDDQGMKIEFNHVAFQYDDQTKVFDDLHFTIQAGERIAISGKDGSGKSTLIRLMSTVFRPNSGTILLNDIPELNYKLENLRLHISIMFNRLDVFNGTIFENITVGNPNVTIKEILPISKKIGLDQFVNSKEAGYDTLVDTVGKRLPRTVIKKILILRAIVTKLPLIILEEPFSEIEEDTKLHLNEIFTNELKNSTLVIVTNEPAFLSTCDKIFQLEKNLLHITNGNMN